MSEPCRECSTGLTAVAHDGPLPCQVCGVAAEGGPVEHRVPTNAFGTPTGRPYAVTTCGDCATLDPAEPGLTLRAAARVIGVAEGDPFFAEALHEDDGGVLDRLLYDGGDGTPGRGARGPQRKPFAHVTKEDRAALKRARVRALDHRVHAASDHDRPVPPHEPPEDTPHRACVACGLGRSEQWYGPVRSHALTRGPNLVTGYLCSACGPALEKEGAVGPGFLERAFAAARGIDLPAGATLPGLRAWVATGRAPGDEPWGWVGEVREPEPDVDPLTALRVAVSQLTARVEALEGRG